MTYLEAIALVEKNEGKEFDYSVYCADPSWDIQMLVEYLNGLEVSDDNDYRFVFADIVAHLDSCGFTQDEYDEVIKALDIKEHFSAISY